jgi:hypothetical protein
MTQPRRHLPEIAKMVYIAPQHSRLMDNVQRQAPGQTSCPTLRTPATMATMRKPEEMPCHSLSLFTHFLNTRREAAASPGAAGRVLKPVTEPLRRQIPGPIHEAKESTLFQQNRHCHRLLLQDYWQ